jgi:hypothetical protein
VLTLVYVALYCIYSVYWLFCFAVYEWGNSIEVRPVVKGKRIWMPLSILYLETHARAYLVSFSTIYITLQNIKPQGSHNRFKLAMHYIVNFIVKIMTGFSLRITRNSILWAYFCESPSACDMWSFDWFMGASVDIVVDIVP